VLSQIRERRFDPREDRSLSELGKNTLGLGQVLHRKILLFLCRELLAPVYGWFTEGFDRAFRSPSTGYDDCQPTGVALKRRSTASGRLTEGRRRKAAKPIHNNSPKAVTRSNSSPSSEGTEVARLSQYLLPC
jgi:hypothetical protein